jgi:hypothetical protein
MPTTGGAFMELPTACRRPTAIIIDAGRHEPRAAPHSWRTEMIKTLRNHALGIANVGVLLIVAES